MPKKLQMIWDYSSQLILEKDFLTIINEPLVKADSLVWFEDYFDYQRYSKEIFNQASLYSWNWTNSEEYKGITVC